MDDDLVRTLPSTEATRLVVNEGQRASTETGVGSTMQRKTRTIIAAVAAVALLAAGGAAFSASLPGRGGQDANIDGGGETVTGAQATAVDYALSSDGRFVDQVAVTLSGDYASNYTFAGNLTDGAGREGAGHDAAGRGVVAAGVCTPGSFTAGSTVVTCDFTTNGAADTGTAVDTVNGFELSVTGKDSRGTSPISRAPA